MEEAKVYTRVCKRCKNYFPSASNKAYICPACKRENELANYKKNIPEIQSGVEVMPLDKLMRLMMRYNDKHNTKYSYGKFIDAIRSGKIQAEELYNS